MALSVLRGGTRVARRVVYQRTTFGGQRMSCQRAFSSHALRAGGFSWPLASKADKGGEDSFFVLPSPENERLLVCGVADGVGGSNFPDIYANTLMLGCSEYAKSNIDEKDPKVLLQGGLDTRPELFYIDGSCTACLMVISIEGNALKMSCANLGDSGYVVVRQGDIIARSTPQLHAPNTPFQLGMHGQDLPSHAHTTTQFLERGDLIAVCSDGVFDNLYDYHTALVLQGPEALQQGIFELRQEEEESPRKWYELEMIPSPLDEVAHVDIPDQIKGSRQDGDEDMVERARTLCAHAVQLYSTGRCMTPWADEHGDMLVTGGKMDDVTAIVIEII